MPNPDRTDDSYDPEGEPHLHLYFGTAGIVLGQNYLEGRGYGSSDNDYRSLIQEARNINASRLADVMKEFPEGAEYARGLMLGDMGFLATLLRIEHPDINSDEVLNLASENTRNSIGEFMWGSPGTMAAALFFASVLDKERLTLFAENAIPILESQMTTSPSLDCAAWRQNLYGKNLCILGAVHGFSGIAFSILKSLEFLDSNQTQIWHQRIRDTAKKTAYSDGIYSNWRMCIDDDEAQENKFLVQFCHGAPGIVCCLSSLIDGTDPKFDSLMIGAGELIWKAGPLKKGANLCHGTSGNGYAFLNLFEATGDERWLYRVRSFAMAAIGQSRADHNHSGQFHHSLWTGDIGLAIYLVACVEGIADIPTMDVF